MKNKPLVSVVIPAYRCSETIKKTIDSVLIQKADFEILVLSDGYDEKLDCVMEEYQKDDRIRYMKNSTNIGAAATRNKGVKMAKGRDIAFLDADDWWAKDKLQCQLDLMKRSDAVLCATARELLTPDGKKTGKVIPVPEKITYKKLLSHNCIACSSVLIKKEAMEAVPMEHDDCHEDYLTWLKILKRYGDGCGVNRPFLKYRLSSTGKSGNKMKAAKMTWKVYQYMGFSLPQSALCFVRYAFHGVWKYAAAAMRKSGL